MIHLGRQQQVPEKVVAEREKREFMVGTGT
jgi:hypothetical protein